jgi:hypothetical protein
MNGMHGLSFVSNDEQWQLGGLAAELMWLAALQASAETRVYVTVLQQAAEVRGIQ